MKTYLSLASVLFLLNLSTAHAATFFVSTTGTGTDCSAANPCDSIQAAVNNAAAGDKIKIDRGHYSENVVIPAGKDGLTIKGKGAGKTVVMSAGGRDGIFAPAGVPLDAVFDVFSSNVEFKKMTVGHPAGQALKRDIAFFVRPPAANTQISKCNITRLRDIGDLEPTAPGSRGVFVIRAAGTIIEKNTFRGNYQDAIHIPAPASEILKNDILNAPRIGIAIIQENDSSDSRDNIIMKNRVVGSGGDGIQMQGDEGVITKNTVTGSGGAGIKLCGTAPGDCVAPGDDEDADNNVVSKNKLSHNIGGDVVDNGNSNIIN